MRVHFPDFGRIASRDLRTVEESIWEAGFGAAGLNGNNQFLSDPDEIGPSDFIDQSQSGNLDAKPGCDSAQAVSLLHFVGYFTCSGGKES